MNTMTLMIKVDDELLRNVIKSLPEMERAFADVLLERHRQDEQWGGPAHDDTHDEDEWAGYIEYQVRKINRSEGPEREAFVKIAALAVAAIQSIDRLAAMDEAHEAAERNLNAAGTPT